MSQNGTHSHYFEVRGDTPADCGRQLGRLFGRMARDLIAEERADGSLQRYRAAAEERLSLTAAFFPSYVEELKAYAEAARVDLVELWTMSILDDLAPDACEHCTTLVTNNGMLVAHNEDWSADAANGIVILKRTCGPVTTLELYYYGCPLGGVAISVSSNGYVQAINSVTHRDQGLGVPKTVLARRLSEVRDLGRELDGILGIPRASGFAHTLIDRTGRATVIELTATAADVTCPGAPFAHTNHLLAPDLCPVAGAASHSSLTRYRDASAAAAPTMDAATLGDVMGRKDRGREASLFNDNTIARAIVDLDRRVASFWLRRERRKGWIDYPIDFVFKDSMAVA